ncbi:methyltransferase domain-containing protein [bacterium]|nr:methyltransferase domain-containing protein [bacterium]
MNSGDIPLKWQLAVKTMFGLETEIVGAQFFFSKKNQVSRLSLAKDGEAFEVMAKCYVWGDLAAEYSVLQKAFQAGLNVPEPLGRLDGILFSRPLDGERSGDGFSHGRAVCLGRWLRSFHRKMTPAGVRERVFLRGDCNLNNFLADKDGLIWGVDFEEACFGSPEADVGELSFSIIGKFASEPEAARVFLGEFLRGYALPLSGEKLIRVIKHTLEERRKYRCNSEIFFNNIDKFLSAYSEEIVQLTEDMKAPGGDAARWKARYEKAKPPKEPEPFAVECLPEIKGGRILDVACGEGRHVLFLAARFPDAQVLGIDRSAEAVETCRRRAEELNLKNVEFAVLDLEKEPLPEGPFDTVIVTRYWQPGLCEPLCRCLAEGGRLIYVTYTVEYLKYGPRSIDHLLSPQELRRAFAGLRVLRYEEIDRPETREYSACLLACRE